MVDRVIGSLKSVQMDCFSIKNRIIYQVVKSKGLPLQALSLFVHLVIILDEATSMLDPKGREEVLNLGFDLKTNHHMTVISITHDLEEAAKADRIIVMNKGKLYSEGTRGNFSNGRRIN